MMDYGVTKVTILHILQTTSANLACITKNGWDSRLHPINN